MAIANMGTDVVLHSYMGQHAIDVFEERAAWLEGFSTMPTKVDGIVAFRYLYDLDVPVISGVPDVEYPPLQVDADKVVRFGMLEGDAVVNADWAVYDPQNVRKGKPFGANGSRANHLALVMNSWEAGHMAGMPGEHPSMTAPALAHQQGAEVVVVKMGPHGAFVWTATGTTQVPAFRTGHVWKVGSGDCFVAHFANEWMHNGKSPAEAALIASRATAYYVETQGLITPVQLNDYAPQAIGLSVGYRAGEVRQVYLAGPFFDLSQVWMVEQARNVLQEMGLKVFSPYHDIGLGEADDVVAKDLEAIHASHLVMAIADGFDPGTVYEIGYARALGKPVVVYSERHKGEGLKMMEGSECTICNDFTTAIYSTLWEAVAL